MKNFLKNVIVSVLSVTIFFGGLELAQRIRYYFKYGTKYYLTYGLKSKGSSGQFVDTYAEIPFVRFDGYAKCVPGTYRRDYRGSRFPVHINREGLRGEEIEVGKEEGVFRAVMLGGSSVQGLESPDDATITSVLQGLINEARVSFLEDIGKNSAEVINAGIIAHTSSEILVMLKEEILELRPDLVIIYTAFNDYRHAGVFDAVGSSGDNIFKRIMGKTWAWFYNHSLLFLTFYEKFTIFPDKSISFKLAEEVFGRYKKKIEAIIEICHKNGIKFVIVKQPLFIRGFPPLQREQMVDEIENRIRTGQKVSFEQAYYWMQSRELGILDELSTQYDVMLIDPIKEIYEYKKGLLFYDIVHFTAEGNALLAKIIFERLAEEYMGKPKAR